MASLFVLRLFISPAEGTELKVYTGKKFKNKVKYKISTKYWTGKLCTVSPKSAFVPSAAFEPFHTKEKQIYRNNCILV